MRENDSPRLASLRVEIRNTVGIYCEDPLFRVAILRTLARPGFALDPEAPCRAGILSLEVDHAISGTSSPAAVQAAAASEFHMQAAYMFDSVADNDSGPDDGLKPAEKLAIAIALLTYGQASVYNAAFAAGLRRSGLQSLTRLAADCASSCCSGQFLDAHLEKLHSATTEDSLKMTSLKAGSLGRFAAGLGASVATEDHELVSLFGDFGFNLFTYLQLLDDLRDAYPAHGEARDLTLNKKTLPVVFFRNPEAERNRAVVCSIIPQEAYHSGTAGVAQEFEASGARLFGAIVAEAFLNRAKARLAEIKNRLGTVGGLERFVRSLEISPQEVVSNP
jgi:geranylgeranyl pyrophosphate synthase